MSVQWNLDQMRLFVSVAEQRSFSAVARDQRKAQSAVSNGIALLEADLGLSLFERSSGRQPRLTEAGSVLLEEAREVLRQCERLNGRALHQLARHIALSGAGKLHLQLRVLPGQRLKAVEYRLEQHGLVLGQAQAGFLATRQ